MRPTTIISLGTALLPLLAQATNPFTQYAVDFPDPNLVAAGRFSSNVAGAEDSIVAWADEMASYGPWSVTFKPVVAPSGDKRDYMSWAPYQWPDCSKVGNKTELSTPDMWKECAYVFKDGQVNPDRTTINDFQSFFNLSDAVLYNSIAAVLQNSSSSSYSKNVAKFVDTWFLNADTGMNPNLNYAQMNRGPNGQTGEYTGVLDLRGFAKIASGILMLRKTKNSDWTSDMDAQFVAWCNKYIDWLQTSPSGKTAAGLDNNHGTIFVNQLAALKLLVNDVSGAVTLIQGYFNGIFKAQIDAKGDQPKEQGRTRPYHYRNFNAAGMITNARLLAYASPTTSPSGWNATSSAGTTIKSAMDFLMKTDPAATNESNVAIEIYPNVAAVASAYGDAAGAYGSFLNQSASKVVGFNYADDPTFLWDQPLAGGDVDAAKEGNHTTAAGPEQTGQTGDKGTNAAVGGRIGAFGCFFGVVLGLYFLS
ncbi:chondroitin AC/alginate lyase [Roridomyces roridus]|uniref:Chondroitin AC/alginate lyase n=1 Tax=Roridomyces roridus TaxID=1738132 RepID=A0AAD7FL49_9AGAR|nr:chondroitin AC/alginate lyase [Roridomyces roridus]